MFSKMPIVLVSILVLLVLFGNFIPLLVKQIIYALGLSIKSLIIFLLPFIIFGLLFKSAFRLAYHAAYAGIIIVSLVCVSNFISTFLSHYVGILLYTFDIKLSLPQHVVELQPAWLFSLPIIISNDKAMLLGVILGMGAGTFFSNIGALIVEKIEYFITKILNILTYLIPFFISGFVVKLQYEGTLYVMVSQYWLIFIIVACAQLLYILSVYLILNTLDVKKTIQNIQNMFPAVLTGFSTMSSAAAMPFTLVGVTNNTKNKDIARAVIPTTVNIHLIGDCIAIPIFSYAVLKSFLMPEPTLIEYVFFTFYFVLAKFSVAAIPGGGIIVMLPILQKYLGFNGDMMSLVTTLYILFDPVITSINILGNGAFAQLIDKIGIFNQNKIINYKGSYEK